MNNQFHNTDSKTRKLHNTVTRRQFIASIALATTGAALISAGKASRWQIGCYTRPWAEYDYRVAFDGIAEAGFKFAGLMTTKGGTVITKDTTLEQAAAIGEEAKSRGLKIASMWGGNFDVKKSIEEGVAGLKRLIDNSAICGCPNLLLGGIATPALVDDYYKVVASCCDYAAEKKVGISVKPHGPLNSTGRECRPLIEKVGHKNFGLWYDPGNIYYYSEGKLDPVIDAAEVDGMVVGMSVKDFRMPPDVNVTPGTGLVDFPKVLARLKKGGFTRGPLIVECLSAGDITHINSEAKNARKFLEKITD
jgi:sugar phosphate isomerase/epimerase